MRLLVPTVAPLLALSIWTGCAETQPEDVSAVVGANCTRNLRCEEYLTFEECSQGVTSVLAAFEHVYGDLCLDAWLGILDCETQQACDEQAGCEPEESTLDSNCGFEAQ